MPLYILNCGCTTDGATMLTACPAHAVPDRGGRVGERYQYLVDAVKQPGDACIYWPHGCNDKGYGVVRVPGAKGRAQYVHRVSYSLHYGMPIPDGYDVDHKCQYSNGNPERDDLGHGCFNPLHLESVTHTENINRGNKEGMAKGGKNSGKRRTKPRNTG